MSAAELQPPWNPARPSFVWMLCLLAGGGVLALVAVLNSVAPPVEQREGWITTGEQDAVLMRLAEVKMRRLTEAAESQMMATIEAARTKSSEALARQRAELPSLSALANGQLQGFGNAMVLVKRMAMDKLRGTKQTQEYLQQAFAPVVQRQVRLETELSQIFVDCAGTLDQQSAQMQAALAQAIETSGFKAAELEWDKGRLAWVQRSAEQTLKGGTRSAMASFQVGLETLLVRTTYQTITRLLAKIVAKQAGSMGIGAAGAPIPGVDVVTSAIAIGGTLWTGWDVYHARDELSKVGPVIDAGLASWMAELDAKSKATLAELERSVATLCQIP